MQMIALHIILVAKTNPVTWDWTFEIPRNRTLLGFDFARKQKKIGLTR